MEDLTTPQNPNPVSSTIATPIGAAIMNSMYKLFSNTPKPKRQLKMLQSDLAGPESGVDPEVFGKDLTPALNAYNNQVGIADSALTSRNKEYNLKNPIAIMGKGKFQGVKITKEMADDAISAAKKYNRDPLEILALMGQESTFSQSGLESEERDMNQRSMTSGWNTSEKYLPYKPEQFLADKQVPGIGKVKINNKIAYTIDDLDAVKAALVKRPGLMAQYMKRIGKTPIAQESYLDMAAGFVAKKGLAGYNPGDPNYVRDVMNSRSLLEKNPALMKYLKSKS